MHTWNGIRKRLEEEYLAPSLRGRITYFAATYRKSHDREGRVALRLDGCEVAKSSYYEKWTYSALEQLRAEGIAGDPESLWQKAQLRVIESGAWTPQDFYDAFAEFDAQPIAESLASENAVVRMFALLDRRVGKRTLLRLRDAAETLPPVLQTILSLRLDAEGIGLTPPVTEDTQ